jgi:hypothetical protein
VLHVRTRRRSGYTGINWREQDGSWRDIEMAKEALSMMRMGGERLGIHSVLPFTEMLVNDQWSYIQLIAGYLLARRELSYDEVLRLVRH